MRELMQKKLHEKPEVYAKAREEMLKHTDGTLPPVLDPFSGGGSIPLEAARLGFEAHAADLNPVAVLLNKCNLELVPRWLNQKPVNPATRNDAIKSQLDASGARGLAEDIRYYGDLIRKRAIAKIGHLYPKVTLPKEHGGREANVIAWIWARTVASPNPAAHGAHVPLISTYWLSSKKGNVAWLSPVIDGTTNSWRFEIKTGELQNRSAISAGTKVGRGGFRCLLTDTPIPFSYAREESVTGRLQYKMIAVVAEIQRGRIYLEVDDHQVSAATAALPDNFPDTDLPEQALGFRVQNYGIRKHWQLFSPRQLTAMTTLSDLVRGVTKDVRQDAQTAGVSEEEAAGYACSVTTFLALNLDRCADLNNTCCTWNASDQVLRNLFKRQAIPMVWDFAEANILANVVGGWSTCIERTAKCITTISGKGGTVTQTDAAGAWNNAHGLLVSTDPPYYDNIGYAALSDFFYIWLRRTIGDLYPDLFKTILVPKTPELTASPERFEGDKEKAKEHFESGFRQAFTTLRQKMDSRFPLTVYYAFQQEDESAGGDASDADEEGINGNGVDLTTGWETLLEALLGSGFQISATWPVRASQSWRMRAMGSNALASYIVLACRARPAAAPQCTRREFLNALKMITNVISPRPGM
jgi:putative DNA methylase